MTRNDRQEALSRAYVQVIAARCGMGSSTPHPDYGIDLTLHDVVQLDKRRLESGFKIDVQAKSTTIADLGESHVRYDLDVRAFDALRLTATGCPRILVLLVLPSRESDWISQSESELIMRHCAYWTSLRGRPATKNRRSIRLNIARTNRFSSDSLKAILETVKRGEQL